MRVLEGKGLSDGYITWFNGSPFVWPVMAAVGHHLGGLTGARLMAVTISMVTLVGFAKTAETLFGESAAAWGTAALSLNGLFIALAHFAVYDVPALAGIALSMWGAARFSTSRDVRWVMVAAVAFAFAVICKYGYLEGRGKEALDRLNWVHGHYQIANEDFLYVLSTFIYEPIYWIDKYGWRPTCAQEKQGYKPRHNYRYTSAEIN